MSEVMHSEAERGTSIGMQASLLMSNTYQRLPNRREFMGHEENLLLSDKVRLHAKWIFVLTNVPFWVLGFVLLSPWAPDHKQHTVGAGFCASNPEQSFWVFLAAAASTVFHMMQVRLHNQPCCLCCRCSGDLDNARLGVWIIILLGVDVGSAVLLCITVFYCHQSSLFFAWFCAPMGLNFVSSMARGKMKRWTEHPHEQLCSVETLAQIYIWTHGLWHVSCGVALGRFLLCSPDSQYLACPK